MGKILTADIRLRPQVPFRAARKELRSGGHGKRLTLFKNGHSLALWQAAPRRPVIVFALAEESARASAGAVPMTTTVLPVVTALGPAPALELAAAEASTRAYALGWQSAVGEALMSWAAGSARKPWRLGVSFVPGLP